MMTTIGAWLLGSLGYAAIAAIVALAVAAHFFSKTVSIVAWGVAVGALALVCVGKDAVIAGLHADAATVKVQHEQALRVAAEEAVKQDREDRGKEAAHAKSTIGNADKFTQGQPARDAALRADLAAHERMRIDADRRAATYKAMSATCAAAASGVADRLAAFDRQLVAGAGVVANLRGDLERRDAEVVLLHGQIQADRKLSDSAPTAPALPASVPTPAPARP